MKRPVVLLVAIAALATVLRLIGVRYGLPAVYNPDEVAIMARTLAFATGDLNPHNFLYPTLYFYVLFAWLGACVVGAWAIGAVASLQAAQAQFFVDPTLFYTAGRLLTVVCGVVTVALVYRWGTRLAGRVAGSVSALFLAVAPFHVRDSHYVKHDVPATLLVAAMMVALSPVTDPAASASQRHRRILAAAVIYGLACSTHYYTVFLALPLAIAVMLAFRTDGRGAVLRMLVVTASISVAVFLLGSPFLVADPGVAIRDIVANRQIVVDRAVGQGGVVFSSLPRYLELLWLDAAGWPVVLLASVGALVLIRQAPWNGALVLSFPLVFLVFVANTVPASRYLNPLLPFVAVLGGCAARWLAGRWTPRLQPVVATVLAIVAAAPGIAASARTGTFFRQADTRTLALQYIERELPAGSSVLIQPYSVALRQSRASLVESLEHNLGSADRASTKFRLLLGLTPYPSPAYRLVFLGDGGLDADKIYISYGAFTADRGLAPARDLGVQHVVVKRYNTPDPATRPFLDALAREARLVAQFSPYRADCPPELRRRIEPFLHNTDARIVPELERPGPVVEIWTIHAARQPAS